VSDVRGIGDDHADMAVDTGAAVPAAVGLRGIIDADGEYVRCGEVQLWREIKTETGVAVGLSAELGAIEVDGRVAVDAIKFDADSLALPIRGSSERFAIPTSAGRKKTAPGSGRIVFVGRRLDAPVVGEIDGTPGIVGEGAGFGAARVA